MTPTAGETADAILALARARGAGSSFCPSEVARALDPADWRRLLGAVRREAVRLAADGRIDILRKGRRLPPDDMPDGPRGVIRLRLAPPAP